MLLLTLMPGERLSSLPYRELSLPEHEVGYLSQSEFTETVLRLLNDNGLYREDALYCGIEGQDIQDNGTFGDRSSTFAVPEAKFREAARQEDEYNNWHENPLKYAFMGTDLPALAVFDRDCFEWHEERPGEDIRWRLLPGHTMDSATLAVVYMTS